MQIQDFLTRNRVPCVPSNLFCSFVVPGRVSLRQNILKQAFPWKTVQ